MPNSKHIASKMAEQQSQPCCDMSSGYIESIDSTACLYFKCAYAQGGKNANGLFFNVQSVRDAIDAYCFRLRQLGSYLSERFEAFSAVPGMGQLGAEYEVLQDILVNLFCLVDEIYQFSTGFDYFGTAEQGFYTYNDYFAQYNVKSEGQEHSGPHMAIFLQNTLAALKRYKNLFSNVRKSLRRLHIESIAAGKTLGTSVQHCVSGAEPNQAEVRFLQTVEYASELLSQLEARDEKITRKDLEIAYLGYQIAFLRNKLYNSAHTKQENENLDQLFNLCYEARNTLPLIINYPNAPQIIDEVFHKLIEGIKTMSYDSEAKYINTETYATTQLSSEYAQSMTALNLALRQQVSAAQNQLAEHAQRALQQEAELGRYLAEIEHLSNYLLTSKNKQRGLQEELASLAEKLQSKEQQIKNAHATAALTISQLDEAKTKNQQLQRQCALLFQERQALNAQKRYFVDAQYQKLADELKNSKSRIQYTAQSVSEVVARFSAQIGNVQSDKEITCVMQKATEARTDAVQFIKCCGNLFAAYSARLSLYRQELTEVKLEKAEALKYAQILDVYCYYIQSENRSANEQSRRLLLLLDYCHTYLYELHQISAVLESRMIGSMQRLHDSAQAAWQASYNQIAANAILRDYGMLAKTYKYLHYRFDAEYTKAKSLQTKIYLLRAEKAYMADYLSYTVLTTSNIYLECSSISKQEEDARMLLETSSQYVAQLSERLAGAEAEVAMMRDVAKQYQTIMILQEKQLDACKAGKDATELKALFNKTSSQLSKSSRLDNQSHEMQKLKLENEKLKSAFAKLSESIAGGHFENSDVF